MTELFDLTFAAISWEPEIRGALAVLIGFVVLCGSIYLLLATNSGARTGLLLALTGLFGWCGIMGLIWTAYGIGWVGEEPSWVPLEVNYEDLSQATTDAVVEDPTLSDWDVIEDGTPSFGELDATTRETLTNGSPAPFDDPSRIYILEMYETGGKPQRESDAVIDRVTNRITNTLRITHPPRYAVVQMRRTVETEPPEPGQPPPSPEPDPEAPVVSLILVRDIGNLRFTPAAFSFFCFVMFGILANVLHRRDKLEAENRARTEPAAV